MIFWEEQYQKAAAISFPFYDYKINPFISNGYFERLCLFSGGYEIVEKMHEKSLDIPFVIKTSLHVIQLMNDFL